MKTLLELVPAMEGLGEREALRHVTDFRTRVWSYRDLLRRIGGVARELDERGLTRGDRILLWGENRPEWVAVFWAAVARGVVVVPLDFRSSPELVARVQADVHAKLLVHGASVDPSAASLPTLSLEEAGELDGPVPPMSDGASPADVVQILYTSGTTGAPKGVVHRHRNLVANLGPIRDEIHKYRHLARPFQPIRTLVLLPVSHVFGQFTGLFVPVALGGAAAFTDTLQPKAVLDTIRRERISVLSSVPRLLAGLRQELVRRFDVDPTRPIGGPLARWWRYRALHRALGPKFWAVLSGGARLPEDDESFWLHVGIALIQGYGLTETSSVVATNHPFHPNRGSLGRTVGAQQVRLAEDGEILVRGDNVSLEYYGASRPDDRGDEWFHTGDLGEIRDDGVLYYVGRKKDVIVGADGLNVHPDDVERELDREPEVKESVVVGRAAESGDVVHAAILAARGSLEPDEARDVIARVNARLEPHQRIREWTVWPDDDFPRTPSTLKIRRREIRERVGAPVPRETTAKGPLAVLARKLGRAPEDLPPGARLDEELGLTSLDRLELQSLLEDETGRTLGETAMSQARTVEDLLTVAESEGAVEEDEPSALDGVVRRARSLPARWLRTSFREVVIRPLFRHYLPLTVEGDVAAVSGPVLFAANHLSNLDTLALLTALPFRLRDRLAPVIGQEFFDPYLRGTGSLRERIRYAVLFWMAAILVGAFPLPRTTSASRRTLRFAGELVESGESVLIFPEGKLTRDGSSSAFRPGVGLLATRLGIPVVPVRLDGLFEVLPYDRWWPSAGPVTVRLRRADALRRDPRHRGGHSRHRTGGRGDGRGVGGSARLGADRGRRALRVDPDPAQEPRRRVREAHEVEPGQLALGAQRRRVSAIVEHGVGLCQERREPGPVSRREDHGVQVERLPAGDHAALGEPVDGADDADAPRADELHRSDVDERHDAVLDDSPDGVAARHEPEAPEVAVAQARNDAADGVPNRQRQRLVPDRPARDRNAEELRGHDVESPAHAQRDRLRAVLVKT